MKLTGGSDLLMVGTRNGMSICFAETDARAVGRTARGVRAISLRDGDEVTGLCVLSEHTRVLTVSETGFGRLSENSDYRVQSRGGFGVRNYRTEAYGRVAAVRSVSEEEDLILISSDGIIIRIPAEGISVSHRPSKGVRVMRLSEGARVVTVADVPKDENEETDQLPEPGEDDLPDRDEAPSEEE